MIEEIKSHMIQFLDTEIVSGSGYYDEDGHCGPNLMFEIKNFWNSFNEKKFIYLISGEFDGEIDLEGGRSYFLSRSRLTKLIFDHIYKIYSLDDYEELIYNSNQFTDDIMWYYNNEEKYIVYHNRESKINDINDCVVKISPNQEDNPRLDGKLICGGLFDGYIF